jgi:integrase
MAKGAEHEVTGGNFPEICPSNMQSEKINSERMSRSTQTKVDYIRVATRLARKAKKELGIEGRDPDPREVVVYVIDTWPTLARATRRFYKASLNYWLEPQVSSEAAEARALLAGTADEDGGAGSNGAVGYSKVKRTSAKRARSLSDANFGLLMDALATSGSRYSGAVRHWLIAGKHAGGRPCEWKTADLDEACAPPVLTLQNAKSTNGRSHGKTRRLALTGVPPKDVQVIRRHIETVKAYARSGKYEEYYENCAKLLQRYARKLWPNQATGNICLYTLRHRFSSDAKSTLSRVGVAAVMGHGSINTAGRHYGKRRDGAGQVSVRPSQEDVEAVRRLNPEAEVVPDVG